MVSKYGLKDDPILSYAMLKCSLPITVLKHELKYYAELPMIQHEWTPIIALKYVLKY